MQSNKKPLRHKLLIVKEIEEMFLRRKDNKKQDLKRQKLQLT